MKIIASLIACLAFTSCTLTIDPVTGEKSVIIDGVALAKVINDKASDILNEK
jgi:hypothetical protein